ncbi:N-acetyltransferase [Vibrio clamense]|uniref:GNAT family N-acetyltransferase n=1 Tax=Vibrio TaxID=662 RepID=UPI000DE87D62|nr:MULTISPECIES: N-acetyltransferase [Vibrio]MDN3698964.1 N-acetyltransferase [Vibrio cortegadensis]NOH82961.1 N-acetyltransferase [Vibrio sp. 03-59-1]RBW64243.1 N-acetyltransferase [Vibrionales bacterium C3R12]TKF20615.1 N-acetyltransferase [Vibrio genomosp. F6]
MLIRTEAPADILTIDRLVKSAFETEAEANLVMKLRENSRLTLSLVACSDDGEIIGHVMFSPVQVDGEDHNWQGLAPLCVKSEYQNQGIATSLIKEAFVSLVDFGYPGCVVLGDPAFYQKFGFKNADIFNFNCIWDVPEGAFQAIELVDGCFQNHSGLIEYSPEFSEL